MEAQFADIDATPVEKCPVGRAKKKAAYKKACSAA